MPAALKRAIRLPRAWKVLHRGQRCSASHAAGIPLSQSKQRGGQAFTQQKSIADGPLFVQSSPELGNPYDQDAPLRSYLKRTLPDDVFVDVDRDLRRFGERSHELGVLHRQCEVEPPYLRKYDAWGAEKDDIVTSPAWKRMHAVAAEEGLVASAYERKHGQWSRIHQVAKNYIFASTSGMYSCPLAMTDGAAKIIESVGTDRPPYLNDAFGHLTSRRASEFWTSGQWMTERRGGSDVANATETVAEAVTNGSGYSTHQLYGNKWFSSATDANMAFTLARERNPDGSVIAGTKGLSLFYVETRGANGLLNGINIRAMKNKLGTRQLPTAELSLNGTVASMVGDPGRGVPNISKMLTVTRLHNSISAVSYMRRILMLARDFATKRSVFGRLLQDHPLHMHTLSELELETRGAFVLVFEVARLLGLEETGQATPLELIALRVLTPLVKLFTAKQAVSVVSEGLESFGGQGYIEDTGIPNLLRDAQVLPIWEGTTNVLAVDVLRAIGKSRDGLQIFQPTIPSGTFGFVELSRGWARLQGWVAFCDRQSASHQYDASAVSARDFAYSLARHYIGLLLARQADASKTVTDCLTAVRWLEREMIVLKDPSCYESESVHNDALLVMEGYTTTQ